MTKILLHGLTTKSTTELIPLANSWLSPPKIEVTESGFESQGYDQTQRAFVLKRQSGSGAPQLHLSLQASADSPLVNPAFVIHNWGESAPKLLLNGKSVTRGPEFRYGMLRTMDGTDLVVWLKLESERPTQLQLVGTK